MGFKVFFDWIPMMVPPPEICGEIKNRGGISLCTCQHSLPTKHEKNKTSGGEIWLQSLIIGKNKD